MIEARKKAVRYLSITLFVLMAVPRLNIKIGPVPIYAIDFLVLLTILYASRIPSARDSPLKPYVLFILLAVCVSELVAGIRMGVILEPVYLIIRTILAASLFFLAPRIIRNEEDFIPVLKALTLGAIITAALMVLTSIPPTRAFVTRYIFSVKNLEPASAIKYFLITEEALRGRSLVGVSILSGAFLNTVWPLTFLLRRTKVDQGIWKVIIGLSAILVPVGVLMTYSRGAVFGIILIVLSVAFLRSEKVRRTALASAGITILVISIIGWDSELFFFERLEESTTTLIENPFDQNSETERFFAYTQPFQHVLANPIFFLVGEGFARWNVVGDNLHAGENAATHAVFAAAYYGYGMFAAFAYVLMWFYAVRIVGKAINYLQIGFEADYSRALFASLAGFSSWFILGHAGVSEARGAMLLFFVFGLVSIQVNMVYNQHETRLAAQAIPAHALTVEPHQS